MIDKMPVVFIGHGSPMNAIENNEFTSAWEKISSEIPQPKAILSISAHWFTNGTRIMDYEHPKMIYDMHGFPQELYEIKYNAVGSPESAHLTKSLITRQIEIDNSWGYDHGTWSVLVKMFPKADIPVYQLSIDKQAGADIHFEIGKQIKLLRQKGVLILGSGNIVHNLSRLNYSMDNGYDWAYEFDGYIKNAIITKKNENLIDYNKAGKCAGLSCPTMDHFFPLLYVVGASDESDTISIYNEKSTFGTLSMTCYLFN